MCELNAIIIVINAQTEEQLQDIFSILKVPFHDF